MSEAKCRMRWCENPPKAPYKACSDCLVKNAARQNAYYLANRDRLKDGASEWARKNPERVWARNLEKYGITPDDFMQMETAQGGLCAICQQPETSLGNNGKIKRLSVDHCHDTGRIRALLCNNCNRAIGLLKDKVEVMRAAIDYLTLHSGVST